jgi:hypothetical protein
VHQVQPNGNLLTFSSVHEPTKAKPPPSPIDGNTCTFLLTRKAQPGLKLECVLLNGPILLKILGQKTTRCEYILNACAGFGSKRKYRKRVKKNPFEVELIHETLGKFLCTRVEMHETFSQLKSSEANRTIDTRGVEKNEKPVTLPSFLG